MTDPEELRERRYRVIDHKTDATGQISDSARVVGFGLMIIYFTLLLTDSSVAAGIRDAHPWLLLSAGALGVFTVVFDYLQYVCAALSARAALDRDGTFYDKTSKAYRAQVWFFRLKQLTAIIGALFVIALMALAAEPVGSAPAAESPGGHIDSG